MTSEAQVQARILLACGALPGIRLFRNTVGEGWVGKVIRSNDPRLTILRDARRVTFGLFPGSPDILGWKTIEINRSMEGQIIAQLVGLEVKNGLGVRFAEQVKFGNALQAAGALYGVVNSTEIAKFILQGGNNAVNKE